VYAPSFGPKSTNCHQTQSYHMCAGGVLVIDTSQVMADIPYGDYFRVESRWEVAPAAPFHNRDGTVTYRSTVWVGLRIPFHRNTMLRSIIEQGSFDESKSSVGTVIKMLQSRLRSGPGRYWGPATSSSSNAF